MALVVKNPPGSAGDIRDTDLIPGLGRSSEGGHGNTLQYSGLEKSRGQRAWWAAVHGITELDTTEQLTLTVKVPFSFSEEICKSSIPVSPSWLCHILIPLALCLSHPRHQTQLIVTSH